MEKLIIDNEEKYDIILNQKEDNFEFYANRYGKKWRDLAGDNLVLAMYHRISYLTNLLKDNNITID